jgi:hypothetical protein
MIRGSHRFFEPNTPLLAIPSSRSPRLLIIDRSVGQRWRDSNAYYPAYRWQARLFKICLRVVAALRPKVFVPATWQQAESAWTFRVARLLDRFMPRFRHSATARSLFPSYLALQATSCEPASAGISDSLVPRVLQWFPQADHCVIIGGSTPHRREKLMAQVRTRSGVPVGFIKYGETSEARQAIHNEIRCLSALPYGCGPTLVGSYEDTHGACLAMLPVPGRSLPALLPRNHRGQRQLLKDLQEYLVGIQISAACYCADEHPAMIRIRDQAIRQSGWTRSAHDLLEQRICALGRDKIWVRVWGHNDFAPWNVFRKSGAVANRLCAVDWEEGTPEGFPGLDLAYYLLQTACLMHRWSPARAVRYALKAMAIADAECYGGPKGAQRAIAIIRLSALDAWLRNEAWVSGNFLQRFRWAVWRGASE